MTTYSTFEAGNISINESVVAKKKASITESAILPTVIQKQIALSDTGESC